MNPKFIGKLGGRSISSWIGIQIAEQRANAPQSLNNNIDGKSAAQCAALLPSRQLLVIEQDRLCRACPKKLFALYRANIERHVATEQRSKPYDKSEHEE